MHMSEEVLGSNNQTLALSVFRTSTAFSVTFLKKAERSDKSSEVSCIRDDDMVFSFLKFFNGRIRC